MPLVSWVLRVGVILSALLLAAALVDALVAPDHVTAIGPSVVLDDLEGAVELNTRSLVHLGLLILLLTPVARVGVLVGRFTRERDTAFVLLSLGVLFLLALSVWLSFR